MTIVDSASRSRTYGGAVGDYVRRAILAGRFPVGATISDGEVARALGIRRTPAREALRLLEHEGLLERRRRGRHVVRGFSARHRHEILEIREALEEVAVRHAAHRLSPQDLADLRALLVRQRKVAEAADDALFVELDEEFHLAIARAADLPLVHRLLEQMGGFVRAMRLGITRPAEALLQVAAEHEAVLDALEQCDEESAVEALREHLHRADYRLEHEGDGGGNGGPHPNGSRA